MRILPEEDELLFTKKEDAYDTVNKIIENSAWVRCDTNLIVVNAADNPIGAELLRGELKIPQEVSHEALMECMESFKLVVSVPTENGYVGYPVGETSFVGLITKAGFGENSTILTQLTDRPRCKRLAPEKVAGMLTDGFECHNTQTLLLVRDEKLRAVLSGNEGNYTVLPFDQILKVFEEEMDNLFMDTHFVDAVISHKIYNFFYTFEADEVKKSIAKVLPSDIEIRSVGCHLVSSDVGLSGANIYPFIQTNIGDMMIGNPLRLDHKSADSIEDFRENARSIIPKFEEAQQRLDKLSSIKVHLIKDCIKNAAKKAGLPMREAEEKGDDYEKAFGKNALMIDVICALYEILENMELKKELSPSRKFILQVAIARVLFSDIERLDVPFSN